MLMDKKVANFGDLLDFFFNSEKENYD